MKTNFFTKLLTITTVAMLVITSSVQAQVFDEATPVVPIAQAVFDTPQFFVCLVAGVLLAIGFQVLLTTLSVASGISLIGNIEKKSSEVTDKDKSSAAHSGQGHMVESNHHAIIIDEDASGSVNNHSTPVAVKISSALGIWTILTVSLSLFLASLFAVKLSLLSNNAIGATLGLVIWAAFFTCIAYLEVKSVSSLVGGILSTALSGVRSSFGAVKDMFGSSPKDDMTKVAKETVHSIRQELSDAMDNSKITRKLDEYIDKLQPQELDYAQIRKEMAKLLEDVELRETSEVADDELIRHTFIKVAQSQPHLSKNQVKKLSHIFDEVKSAASTQGSTTDKVMTAVDKLTPGTEEASRTFREKIETYLRNTHQEAFNPDSIKKDIESIIQNPGNTRDILRNRIGQIDRTSLVALLAGRGDISQDRANQIVGYVGKAFDAVKQKFASGSDGQSGDGQSNSPQAAKSAISYDSQTTVQKMKAAPGTDNQNTSAGFVSKFEDKLKNYFDSMNRPEFNYDRMKTDVEQIFHEPGTAFSVLKNRLGQYDQNSLVALLSSRENISQQDAERMVAKIEESRDNVLQKAEKIEQQVQSRLSQAKEMALHEAENVRAAAASAAWWLFAAAVVSAVASAVGGMLAITA